MRQNYYAIHTFPNFLSSLSRPNRLWGSLSLLPHGLKQSDRETDHSTSVYCQMRSVVSSFPQAASQRVAYAQHSILSERRLPETLLSLEGADRMECCVLPV
jgi:hypothetical protein